MQDLKRARNFYENILGLEVSKISDQGAWIEYDLPAGGCFAITTLVANFMPDANSGGLIAFEVEDLDKLVDRLKSLGVEFKMNIIASHICRIAVILDSEGNAVALHQLHKSIK